MIRVKAAFFSLTPPGPPDDDGSYLRWHLLDHQPEQYQLPGIQLSLRYIADGDYLNSRIAGEGPLVDVGNVVNYFVGDPVQQTHDDFMELGGRLAERGRYPDRRPFLQLRMPALIGWYASTRVLISPEVVPWRPHRGIVILVEQPVGDPVATASWLQWVASENIPALLQVPGVAGAWMYGDSGSWRLNPATQGEPQHTTVIYLDDDPLLASSVLRPLIESRWASGVAKPLFAGPLRTMVKWDAWP